MLYHLISQAGLQKGQRIMTLPQRVASSCIMSVDYTKLNTGQRNMGRECNKYGNLEDVSCPKV